MNLFPKFLLLIWLICLPTLVFTFNKYKSLNAPIDFNSELKLGKQSFNIISNSKCVGNFSLNFYEEKLSTYKIDINFLLALKANKKIQEFNFESVLQFNPFLQLASTSNRLKFANYTITLSSFGINEIKYVIKVYKDKVKNFMFENKLEGPFELKQVSSDTFVLSNFNQNIFNGMKDKFPKIINNQGISVEPSDEECKLKALEINSTNLNINSFSNLLK